MDANGQITVASNAVLDFETQHTYTLELDVSDSKDTDGNSDSEVDYTITITINLADVPVPPQIDEHPGFSTSDTDDPTSMLLLTWTAPTLPDGAPSITSYEIWYKMQEESNWTDHEFDYDGTTTETTITGLASNTYYDAQVRAVNVEGSGGWSPTSSAKTTEAELTMAFDSLTYTVNEGGTSEITVNVTPAADRGVTVTATMTGSGATLSGLTNVVLTIAREQSSVSFTISGEQDDDNATDDEVTLTLSKDEDTYNVVLGNPATVTIVDDEVPNFPPVITTTSPISVKENQTAVATLEATDPEDDPVIEWSITGGADRALFSLTNGGVLTFVTAPNYENPKDSGKDNGYEVIATASDGTNNSTPKTITVNVTNVDEPPGSVDPVTVSAPEHQ